MGWRVRVRPDVLASEAYGVGGTLAAFGLDGMGRPGGCGVGRGGGF